MSNGETSVTESEVKTDVDRIEQQLLQLKSATLTSIWVGRLVLLVITIVIFLQILSIYRFFTDLDRDAYATAAQEEIQALIPSLSKEAGNIAESLAPVYQEALLKEFDQALPEIAETFSNEVDLFIAHVGDNIQKSMDRRFQKILDKQLGILAKDIPELKDDAKRKVIMDNVLDCAYDAGQKLSNDLFKPQIDALADLSATIESAQIPANIREMNDAQLLYYSTNKIGDLFLIKMVIFEDVFVESVKKDIEGK